MLIDFCCRVADREQRFIYVEATSDAARAWLKKCGFFELLRHVVRPHAPPICVMVRRPRPATPQDEPTAAGSASGPSQPRRLSSAGVAAGPGGTQAEKKLRPSASVRSR